MNKILPVLLSGGSGTRLWPASRSMRPKQFLPLTGENTLLQETALRLDGLAGVYPEYLVVCNEAHRFLVAEQLRTIGKDARIILEPEGRNTAPAIALAALLSADVDPDTALLVMPTDHLIGDTMAFQSAVMVGLLAAEQGKLTTFGIVPDRPATGFGYIKSKPDGQKPVAVERFVEKPDEAAAKGYVESGEYFWNSGMFLFTAGAYLDALRELAPDMYAACARSMARRDDGTDFIRPDAEAFAACPSGSIDYAVLEKTADAAMVPLDAGWSDVGSWEALHAIGADRETGNKISGDVLIEDCRDTYVSAEGRLVAAVGLEDIVIVETKDSTLVVKKSRSHDVKGIVDRLEAMGRNETRLHRQVFRPWGSFDSLENEDGFRVKRLVVDPGAVLSLQKHARRAEHWVVVRGKARITKNEDEFNLGVNESCKIAIGDVHRIANPFDDPVHIIEVQCGDYLGEDDIVRLEDKYGREATTN